MAPKLARYFLIVLVSLIMTCLSQTPHFASASLRSPSNAYMQAHTNVAGTAYSLPSWWNGQDCDATHYQQSNPNHAPSKIMASWNGLEACKPEPGLDPNSPYIAPVQFVPNPNNTTEQEWQCTELVKRWMLLAWGLPSVSANGDQVVSAYANAYPNEVKQILNNGQTHVFPKIGDILSYSTVHTALVIGVKVAKPPSQGNATLSLLEQNASPTGMTTQQVINWVIKGGIDDPNHTQPDAVSGWLTPRTWGIVSSPNKPQQTNNSLNGIASVSSTDMWAVGSYSSVSSGQQPLIEHYNGTKWSIINNPSLNPNSGQLNAVTTISSNDIWAVGYFYQGVSSFYTLIEHWDGTKWSVIPSPSIGPPYKNNLSSVAAVSSNDVWAVGIAEVSNMSQALIEHWDGTSWSIIQGPNEGANGVDLYAVTAISANDVWASGDYYNVNGGLSETLTLHWDGTQWSNIPSPNLGTSENSLYSISAISTSDIWAVGYYHNQNPPRQTLTLHWDGNSWSVIQSPNVWISENALYSVSASPSGEIWAVGTYSASGAIPQTLILNWNSSPPDGSSPMWSVISSPNKLPKQTNTLNSVTTVSMGTWTGVWAVGSYGNSPGLSTLSEDWS